MSSIIEKDKQFVANTYARFPLEIVSGKGSYLYTADGKKYIDMGIDTILTNDYLKISNGLNIK